MAVLYERGLIRPAIHIAAKTSAAPVKTAVTASKALFVIPKMFKSNMFNYLILANLDPCCDANGQNTPNKVVAKVTIFILKKPFCEFFFHRRLRPKKKLTISERAASPVTLQAVPKESMAM